MDSPQDSRSPESSDVQAAHGHSSRHRAELSKSTLCGCFFCCSTFAPAAIHAWTDEDAGEGQTALCPICGIDGVIGDRSGYPITKAFLKKMRAYWSAEG